MSTRRIMMPAVVLLSLIGAAFLLGDQVVPAPKAVTAECFLGHLSTDKPIYRIGEPVFFRGVVLGALKHEPLPANTGCLGVLAIAGPHGEQVFQQAAGMQDSVGAFNWTVPQDAAGGVYTATLSFPENGYPPTERKFEVRAFRAPRLKGEIVFLRDGFGPGETVKASLHVERAEGGLPVGAIVTANAIVDGKNVYTGNTSVDAAGNCSVAFALPKQIDSPDGTLSLSVADGGVIEPIAKTIPILLKTIDLAIYPEGGDLVAGLPCRVYIEARTTAKKPADVVGQVFDAEGKAVADVKTEHEGRGRFAFTPKAGEAYSIKLSQPAGIAATFPLPAAKATGVVLNSATNITAGGAPVKLNLLATDAGTYTIELSKRQTEICSTNATLAAGVAASLVLTPPTWADGVLVATVKKADGTPVAERLIFRKSTGAVHVQVTTDKSSYNPANKVTVTIKTTDDAGKPIPAMVGITATDQSIMRMMEKRDRAPRLVEMTLLEDDVRELADSGVYLDPTDPKAPLDTDLLLGTQGWRRFATVDSKKFMATFGDSARRVLGDVQPAIVYQGEGMMAGDLDDAADRLERNGAMHGHAMSQLAPRAAAAPVAFGAARAVKDLQQQQIGQQKDQLQMRFAANRRAMFDGTRGILRIYAHSVRPDRSADDRSDFTDTIYWAAGVKTDDKTGLATVSFDLNDSVTSFDIAADAFDAHGQLGEGTATITSSQPFYLEPKLPLTVSAGDVIHLPIAVVNGTPTAMSNVQLTVTDVDSGGVIHISPFDIPAGQRVRKLVDIKVGPMPGTVALQIKGNAGAFSDTVTRSFVIDPLGFPTAIDSGGILAANSKAAHTVVIPNSVVPGSMKASAALYPTPLANLTEALKGLLQEPNGCFEQTTSTNYPVVMADQYFTTHTGVDPALIAQSNDLLDKGYARLISFECQNKGYEWFGQDPGHECLTAYGLLEFTDMSAVHGGVDPKMLADTRTWLMARRDGKGGYTHERRSLHTWITDPGCANGYCTWALLETGQTGMEKEVKWLVDNAKTNPNSYVKALAANSCFLAGDKADAKAFMDDLARKQDKDGHVLGAITTVVGSGGASLQIETTSLATLAWLRDPAYAGNVERGIRYLANSCKAGRYGSTQSTVLALRAIVDYDKARAHPTAAGKIQLFVDDKNVGEAIAFDDKTTGAIKLPDFSKLMLPGQHTVELRMTNGSDLPYAMTIGFNSITPAPAPDCKLAMTTALQSGDVAEGSATELRVTVSNLSSDTQPTPLAIVGIPGGLEVRPDQLKELVKAERIASYEVRGRDLVLYWRNIQPKETITIPVSLTAAVPGTYSAPASRAYLYYTDELKQWIPGVKVTVH